MPEDEVEEKFRGLSRHVMKPAQTDRLLAALWKVEDIVEAGEMVRFTVPI